MPIDAEIRTYIKKINAFNFVRTRLSCQGHFCKSPQGIILYYGKLIKEGFCSRRVIGRIKTPFVLLKFEDKSVARKFVRLWMSNRTNLYQKKCDLYVITPKNEGRAEYFNNRSFFVSRFDDIYVSVSYVLGGELGTKYYENKQRYDQSVRTARKNLFDAVLFSLRRVKKSIERDERSTS